VFPALTINGMQPAKRLICFCLLLGFAQAADSLPALKVSNDHRGLVTTEGKPFFWLGDTAWDLFAKLDLDKAKTYLRHRRAQGFTVVQAHLLDGDFDSADGRASVAFQENDFARPNPEYWKRADAIIAEASAQGFYLALVPAWARSYIEGKTPRLKDAATARLYGSWLARRYKARRNIIWILGGDVRPTRHEIYDALAEGLTAGTGRGPDGILISYHPPGGTYRPPATSTSEWYHDKPWLDFNMIQSGHRVENRNYLRIAEDYAKTPPKPTMESEPCYEAHPIVHDFKNGECKDHHVRQRAYWSILAGGFGFTYGGNGVWQMDEPGRVKKESHHNLYWYDALELPGANQMRFLRALFESRLQSERIPDQTIVKSPPGDTNDRVQAARNASATSWLIYTTDGHPIRIDPSKIASPEAVAWWFNPRTGLTYSSMGLTSYKPFPVNRNGGEVEMRPPGTPSEGNDWVLVLDGGARSTLSAPGRRTPGQQSNR
jgi:hypothetical protein